jgi:hydroxylamine dehydrogenase
MRSYCTIMTMCMAAFMATTDVRAQEKASGAVPVSDETRACLDCHKSVTPGIVEDWLASLHATTTPALALKQPALVRRISNGAPPPATLSVAVGCFECHGQNASGHKDNFEHFGYRINVIVTPPDCKVCVSPR